jgi:hypothetical protein
MMDACPDCIYASRAGVKYGASTPVYRCRRFPPTLLPRYSGAENQFPVVSEKNWCGEFHDIIKAAPMPEMPKDQHKRKWDLIDLIGLAAFWTIVLVVILASLLGFEL